MNTSSLDFGQGSCLEKGSEMNLYSEEASISTESCLDTL